MRAHIPIETWQKLGLIVLVPLLITIFFVGREIYRAVHADSRPVKRKKNKPR